MQFYFGYATVNWYTVC